MSYVNLIYNKKPLNKMKDIWNLKYDWNLIDSTWCRTERLDVYWSGITYIPDNYFKYQKCLSGITYQYVNTLEDIYTKNAMVGKTWCIYDMYNEFDIINNFMVNIDTVDICSTTNLDLTQRYYKIDNTYLKTKHKILLVNQNNKKENGLYNVNQMGYLIPSNFLTYSGNTFRYKAYIKLGDNKHNEYHLKDIGGIFPVYGEESEYMLGKTYILKHFFTYNINADVPKLIFTDYDIARHINPLNYSLYTGFTFTPGDITIKYHDLTGYTVTNSGDINVSGETVSGSTIYYGDYIRVSGPEIIFYIKVDSGFISSSSVNDYLKITFSGNTNLEYYTFIKYNDGGCPTDFIALRDPIPLNILNDFITSGSTYSVTNLQFSSSSTFNDILLSGFTSKYFDISGTTIVPKYYQYDPYFDYDGLQFDSSNFITNNIYVKYKLYEHLNLINSTVFNNSYVFGVDFSLTDFTTGITIIQPSDLNYQFVGVYPKGTYIKITPTNPNDVYSFKNNTFVNLNGTYKTLIVDYVPNEYFVIETYKSNSGLTITSIDTIYTLTGISDLLYFVYKNDENDWYRERPDNIRKTICNSYSRIIETDDNIKKYTTALLTQDDKNKFILELYNPENLFNNGENITYSYDPNLVYKPIELIEIGVDKHTKIPIPILNDNLSIIYDTGTTSGVTYDKFSFEINSNSFSYTLKSTDLTTLDIDWGDGTLETISFNGDSGVLSHSYSSTGNWFILFSGDLQYIYYFESSNSDKISYAEITTIKNLITLNLNDNILDDLNISGLIYLKDLYLLNNNLLSVDKFFNLLNSYNSINGNINTSGGNNASVTSSSASSISNLGYNGWTLIYN